MTPQTLSTPPNTSPIQASPPPHRPPPLLPSTSLPSQHRSRAQRKNMFVALATVDSPPAVTLLAIFAFTQVNETTDAPSPVARLDVPGKITCSNSKYRCPSY